jgi:NitT/TauT family transport system substrate-binding protein
MESDKSIKFVSALLIGLLTMVGCGQSQSNSAQNSTIRVGYFPNLTHAVALVGMDQGIFQQAVGEDITIDAKQFNAGPAEMEALLAGEIDLAYVGPSPAINAYVKSNGEALRIIAGAASGGASFVVQPNLAADYQRIGAQALIGKKIASPQLGNTQDIALRTFLSQQGILEQVQIIPLSNADQLTLFQQQQLDGAWAPEPWVSRLVEEGNGSIVIDERELWPNQQFASTNLVVRTEFLAQHPELVKQWLQGHVTTVAWINDHTIEAQAAVNKQLEQLTTKRLPDTILTDAWGRFTVTVDPLPASGMVMAQRAFQLDFLGDEQPDLSQLYNTTLLNEITGQQY